MTVILITADINQSVSRMMRKYDRSPNHPTYRKGDTKFPLPEEQSLDHLKLQLKMCKESLSKIGSIDKLTPEEQFQTLICRSFCKHTSSFISFKELQQQQYEDNIMKVFRQQDLFQGNKNQDLRNQMEEGDLSNEIGIYVQITQNRQEGHKT